MITVTPLENESFERLIKRFNRIIKSSKLMIEIEAHSYFIPKSVKKRSKKNLSKRRKQMLTIEQQ